MRKLISISMVTILVAVLLVFSAGTAMADTTEIEIETMTLTNFPEEQDWYTWVFTDAELHGTVTSACVVSGTVDVTNGLLVVVDTDTDSIPDRGFFTAEWSATLDGRSYSGKIEGIGGYDPISGGSAYAAVFYDTSYPDMEGRFIAAVDGSGNPTSASIEITWKDGEQCYCQLTPSPTSYSFPTSTTWDGPVGWTYSAFNYTGSSTGSCHVTISCWYPPGWPRKSQGSS